MKNHYPIPFTINLGLQDNNNFSSSILGFFPYVEFSNDSYLEKYLHDKEIDILKKYTVPNRRNSYISSRFLSKIILMEYLEEDNAKNIYISKGIFNQPLVNYNGNKNVKISISHCEYLNSAICFPESHPIGIDIEKVKAENYSTILTQLTPREISLINKDTTIKQPIATVFWSVKEALSKIIGTGMLTPFEVFEIISIEGNNKIIKTQFKNFPQYSGFSIILKDFVFSIVYPHKINLSFNQNELEEKFLKCIN